MMDWILAIPVVFTFVVVLVFFNLTSRIKDFQEKMSQLTDLVSRQNDISRYLLTSYMNESRMMSFYKEALAQCEDPEVTALIKKLMDDEERHLSILEDCLRK